MLVELWEKECPEHKPPICARHYPHKCWTCRRISIVHLSAPCHWQIDDLCFVIFLP